ncbi:MAG: SDR family NAD(P)-dependent oxidoreductase [Ignavibacteriaceae bacterium]
MFELKNKNILLTGASSEIGLELAKLLAKENCNLALLARRKEVIDEQIINFEKSTGKIVSIKCDVTKKDEVKSAVSEIKNVFGKIDAAILNSGVSLPQNIKSFSSKSAEETFNVNVMGLYYFVEELIPGMIANKNGLIVGVSSLADGRGFPKSGTYCASKAAATTFLESLRIELKKYNVKVITVKPGFVKTPMTDKNNFKMPFLMGVEKAAKIIINGIKKEKRIIQFPLPTVAGAKILRLLPDSLFEFIARSY